MPTQRPPDARCRLKSSELACGKAIQRIQSVVPHWRYHLCPDASHALPAEVPYEVNACIRQFVIEHGSAA
jgi:hypothetical protein